MTIAPIAIGLGANVGEPLPTMREAVRRIDAKAKVVARSRVWKTTPIGGPPQPDFFNGAVLVLWAEPPIVLLDELMAIEAELGRVRDVRNGPRTIDLDILWIEGVVLDGPRLVVPHPRLHERAFAVAPLLDIAPRAADPRTGRPYVVPSDQGVEPVHAAL